MDRYGMDRASAGMAILGAFAVGVLAMYLLDPQQGNRRRAVIRDKLYSASLKSRKLAQAKSRDFANRAQGVAAGVSKVARTLSGSAGPGSRMPGG